ncbi:hypothetical protein GCM10010174_79390 [Kutzneria viridogrisea]|uniref:Amino acid adenylation domain-containing protein n=1 Tax=Kutzneria viridogrisea TaxID=47990 RepID=A0ABR6BBG5_9PSEU|nr:amino acid adenylation domain-containing protein [Kutzneria viridogrisea]
MAVQVEGYRLSAQQLRVWQQRQRGRECRAQALVRIRGQLDVDRLASAVATVVREREMLRTSFHPVQDGMTAVQVVSDEAPLVAVRRIVLNGQSHLERIRRAEWTARGDLHTGSPLRVVLITRGPDDHALLITTTALVADSAALRTIVADLVSAYRQDPLDHVGLRHSQLAQWQHELGQEPQEEAVALLRRRSVNTLLRLPLAGGHQEGALADGRYVTVEMPQALHSCAARLNTSVECVLLACWQVLLSRVSGRPDLTVGTCFPGRDLDELRDCAGPLARWVGVRSEIGEDTRFNELVASTEAELSEVDELAECLLDPYATEPVAWEAAFEYKTAVEPLAAGAVTFTLDWEDVEAESYDLKLECVVGADTVRFVWHYVPDRFAHDYVTVLARQYATVLAEVTGDPTVRVADLDPLDAPTRHDLVVRFNLTANTEPARCLHELFEDQAAATPNAVAVHSGDERLSYRELDERANALAGVLRARGVGPEVLVGVGVRHSANLVVALLGVLKAGGGYVPLDVDLPAHRVATLLGRVGSTHLVTDDPDRWVGGFEVLDITESRPTCPRPDSGVTPDNLAYVIFTSGSTGVPKGVMIPHSAVANYVRWSAAAYGTADTAAVLHSSVAFDLTVTSLFTPLVAGGSVRINPAWRDVLRLAEGLPTLDEPAMLKLTPSHLKVLNHSFDQLAGRVRALVVGGEALTADVARPWRDGPTRLFNEYGPTEATVGCSVHEVTTTTGPVTIGRPIANTQIYVLDQRLRPVGVGVTGEIYIGGAGLARGYHSAPGLTAQRFVPDPFADTPGGRLYRTGDLACHTPGGGLHYVGRVDDQVKIRGVRVEPEEVRAALLEHEAVRDAVVVASNDENRGTRLVAYLLADVPPEAEIDAFVRERLPAELVPEEYHRISEIPLTTNGKVDVRSLAEQSTTARSRHLAQPVDAVELVILRCMEELLGTQVGADEDFFDLGGHSLLAVQLIARINEAMGLRLPVTVLFDVDDDDGGHRLASATRLARLVRTANSSVPLGSLVRLRRDGAGLPLVCVHPAGGDVLGFRSLSLRPELGRPVYALQAPTEPDAGQDVTGLADRYVAEVAGVPGPHVLLGWSMGGLVALELARRLASAGERPAMVVLVDTYPPELVLDGEPVTIEDVTGQDPSELSAVAREHLQRRLELYHVHSLAASRYVPAPWSGPVALLQSADTDPAVREKASARWRELCPGLVDTRVIAGDHFSLFQEPQVGAIAEFLAEVANQGH